MVSWSADVSNGVIQRRTRCEHIWSALALESGRTADIGGRLKYASSGHCRHSPNGFYGRFEGLPDQSALMLRARMTLPHFSVSSAMNLPNSAGDIGIGTPPRSASRALIV